MKKMFRSFAKGLINRFRKSDRSLGQAVYDWQKDVWADQTRLLGGKSPNVILDIGANIGHLSAAYHKRFPLAQIYAFEPFPEVYHQLERRFEMTTNVHPQRYALDDFDGVVKLFTADNQHSVNSLYLPLNSMGERLSNNFSYVQVPAITLSSFCKEKGIEHIDIIKMDVQGHELKVLQGATNLLTKSAIDVIYCEVWFMPLYEGQCTFWELAGELAKYQYEIFGLYNFNFATSGRLIWGDSLFISPLLVKQIEEQPEKFDVRGFGTLYSRKLFERAWK